MKLYLNEMSSATSRVRIALSLKGLNIETQSIGIFGSNSESRQAAYREINPQGLVPALDIGNMLLTQSLAIVEYLNELTPEPNLLPNDIARRALARSIAMMIASEIHALVPPRVALHLSATFNASPEATKQWTTHWVSEGFDAIERVLQANRKGYLAVGDNPTIADIFLFPQAVGARRLGLELSRWPNIAEVVERLETIPSFATNAPAPRV